VILLSTSSLNWYGLHRIFQFAHKAWYDWIDIALWKINYDYWDEEYIKELSKAFNLPVLSITAPAKWMNQKKVDRIVKIASTLWSQLITFSPPHFSDKNTSRFTRYLLKVKRDTHISIAIQNVEPKFLFFIIPEYKNSTLYEIKKTTWDATLDLSSIDWSSWMDILKAQKMLWSSMKNIFLSDKHGNKVWILPWQAWWGISYLPLESFFMKLKTTGYNGFITLKVKPSELWVWTEEKVFQNLEYAINYYKKHFLNYK
jgi:sugar phosphate isomerase/epimerase